MKNTFTETDWSPIFGHSLHPVEFETRTEAVTVTTLHFFHVLGLGFERIMVVVAHRFDLPSTHFLQDAIGGE